MLRCPRCIAYHTVFIEFTLDTEIKTRVYCGGTDTLAHTLSFLCQVLGVWREFFSEKNDGFLDGFCVSNKAFDGKKIK